MEKVILFDTEYTSWEGSLQRKWSEPWEHREIIQIAAVKLSIDEDVVEEETYDCLVKPVVNPRLSDYFVQLTGISQAVVEEKGSQFQEAYQGFLAFCEHGALPAFSWGDDPAVIRENCVLNGLPYKDFPRGFHDIRDVLETIGIDTRPYSSGTVYQAVQAPFDLASHNALNDVRSMEVALATLNRAGRLPQGWSRTTKCFS